MNNKIHLNIFLKNTDWHRYNLKRKVAELPPVKEADFANRMVKHEEQRKALNGETKVRF